MKNFKIITTLIAIFFLTQQSDAQIKFGITAGANLSKSEIDIGTISINTKHKPGLTIGVSAEKKIGTHFSLNSSILYNQKGYVLKDLFGANDDSKLIINYNYIDIPLEVGYTYKKFKITGGPYVSYALGGKASINDQSPVGYLIGEKYDDEPLKIKPSFKKVSIQNADPNVAYMHALDFGLNIGIGYKLGPCLIQAKYSLGINNISPRIEEVEGLPSMIEQNRSMSLTATYFFEKKNTKDKI